MNTIDDLKTTLASHADLRDDHLAARSGAVAGRVSAVRRRRAAVAAGVAVAVVAGLVAVLLQPDPADDNLLAGNAVPATLTSTGYTYEYVAGEESAAGEETLRIRVTPEDEPRLVSWATEGAGQEVEVSSEWGEAFGSSRPDFTDFVAVPPNYRGWIEVSADSRVALATYELSDDRPEGYTHEGVTFRQDRAGWQLVGAVVGDRGQTSVSLTFTLPEEGVYLAADLCQASSSMSASGQLAINGTSRRTSGSCDPPAEGFRDGGSSGGMSGAGSVTWSYSLAPGQRAGGARLRRGDEVTITQKLVHFETNDVIVTDEEALLGFAVYAQPEGEKVLGHPVDPRLERDGHIWSLHSVRMTDLPVPDWSVRMPRSDERMLVGTVFRWDDGGYPPLLPMTVDGDEYWKLMALPRANTVSILPRGAEEVGLRSPGRREGRAALIFYELVE